MPRKLRRSLRTSSPVHRRVFQPVLIWLEARTLLSGNPTYYTVNLTSDTCASSGTDATTGYPAGDLLWAMGQANANANPAGSVISFDPSVIATRQTITLSRTLELSGSAGPEVIDATSVAGTVVVSGGYQVGVFQVDGGVTATLSGLTITRGAATSGGGISNQGTLTVSDCTVSANVANDGGGIEQDGGKLDLINSTAAGNTGYHSGGGIYDSAPGLTVINSTIAYNATRNASAPGGGIYNAGCSPALENTIVASNMGNPENIAGTPLSSASAYNLIGTGGAGGLTNGTSGNLVGVFDPGLAAGLANNGGTTQTLALLPGSPAIDHGSNALASAYSLSTDQRGAGFPRIVNGTVDIGAFESPVFGNPNVYTVDLASDTGAFNGTSATTATTGDLLWAIAQANANTNPAGSVTEFDPTVFNASTDPMITLTSTLELSEAPWPEVIQGPGAKAATISGNNGNDAVTPVFHVGFATTAVISGATISGANGTRNSGIWGAILNNGCLTVTGCTIAKNSAFYGGGIGNSGRLTVTDSTIEDNSGGFGGAVDNTIGAGRLTDDLIEGNTGSLHGGGIQQYLGTMAINGCTITGNSSPQGGGIYIPGAN